MTAEPAGSEFPVAWEHPSDPALAWEFDDMHTPLPLAPLAGDYARLIAHGISYRFRHFGLPVRFHCRVINHFAYFADELLVPEDELPQIRRRSIEHRRAQARRVRRFWEEDVYPVLRETYAWMRAAPVETASREEAASIWEEAWARATRLWELHFMINAGSYQSLDDLADLYESLVPGARPDEALRLVQGLPNDLHSVQRDLYLLAEQARSSPGVVERIIQDPNLTLSALVRVPGSSAFLATLQNFLATHGHLGQPFDDLAVPSWADEPTLLLTELRKRLLSADEDPEQRRQRQGAQADALAAEVRARLRDRPDDLRRFEEALALAREAGPLTEGHNYWLDRMLQAHVRRLALRAGARLVSAHALAHAEDILFLHTTEVAALLREPADRGAEVARRRADLERWRGVKPPRNLGKQPSPPPPNRFEPPPQEQSEDRLLRGTGACAGTGRGPARIVAALEDFARVQPGDVLVCPSSNPSWVPLFGIIAGLVTNTGGVLCHAAVVAREFGVPAVVGTGVATEWLREGQLVEVDGTVGEVRVL